MHTPTRSADQPALPPFTRWELGHLVDSWAQSGRTLPVAVVVSIFDDLCEALAGAPPGDDVVVSLDHVVIDQTGVARMTVRPREVVPAVSALLREALAAGRGDEAIPAAAWPVLGQGLADDPWVRPAGTDVIQHQLREALGPPAARDEVVVCCAALASGAPRTSVSAPAPMPSRLEARSAEVAAPAAPTPWEVPSIVPMEVELGSIVPERAQLAARDPHDASTDVATPLEVPSIVGPASELPAAASWRPRWGEDAQPPPQLTRDRAPTPAPPAASPAAPVASPAAPPPLRRASVTSSPRSTSVSAAPAVAAAPTTTALRSPAPAVASSVAPAPVDVPTASVVSAVPSSSTVELSSAVEGPRRAPAVEAATPGPRPSAPAVVSSPRPDAAGASVPPRSTPPVASASGAERSAAADRLLTPAPLVAPDRPAPAAARPGTDAPAVSSTPPGARATVTAVLPEDLDEPPSLLPKPVVRHDPPRRRAVSLPAAPAARLGSTASTPLEDRTSAIQLPSESPLQRILIGSLALASAVLVAWLLGLI